MYVMLVALAVSIITTLFLDTSFGHMWSRTMDSAHTSDTDPLSHLSLTSLSRWTRTALHGARHSVGIGLKHGCFLICRCKFKCERRTQYNYVFVFALCMCLCVHTYLLLIHLRLSDPPLCKHVTLTRK